MKNVKTSLLLLIFLHVFQTAHASLFHPDAQNDSIRKPYYRAWVHCNDGTNPLKGFIYQTTDSCLVLVDYPEAEIHQVIPVRQIRKVCFRRVNNPLLSALAGAGAGIISGAILGYERGDDNPDNFFSLTAGQNAVLLAIIFFPLGLIIGFGLGFIKKKRKLSGNLQNFERERAWIQRFTLTKK